MPIRASISCDLPCSFQFSAMVKSNFFTRGQLSLRASAYSRHLLANSAYAHRQTTSAIDKYALQLSSWLKTEAGKNRKQRRSLQQLHLDLKELGFEGSYDRVAAFARKWKVDQTDRVNSASKRTVSEKFRIRYQ